jgi:anti-anti-sigma factor
MATLQIELIETSQGVVARLYGDAGMLATDSLQMSLASLSARRPALVVFDMAQLAFVASLFMGALVSFRRGLVRHGGRVKLAASQPCVLEAFQRSRLDELFEFVESVDQALVS